MTSTKNHVFDPPRPQWVDHALRDFSLLVNPFRILLNSITTHWSINDYGNDLHACTWYKRDVILLFPFVFELVNRACFNVCTFCFSYTIPNKNNIELELELLSLALSFSLPHSLCFSVLFPLCHSVPRLSDSLSLRLCFYFCIFVFPYLSASFTNSLFLYFALLFLFIIIFPSLSVAPF